MREEMSQGLDFWDGLKGSQHGTSEENRVLLERYKKGEEKAKEELLLKNAKLVKAVLNRYFRNMDDQEDLLQEGMIGLVNAIEKFDPDKGTSFSTYAVFWIRQAIFRYVSNTGRAVRLPVHMISRVLLIFKENSRRAQNGEPQMTEGEIQEMFGFSDYEMSNVRKALRIRLLSINEPMQMHNEEGDELELGEVLADDRPAVEDIVEEGAIRESVGKWLSRVLDGRELDIIRRRYGIGRTDPQTLEEISREYGLSRERIRQIEAKAMKKMRRMSGTLRQATGYGE